MDIEVHNCNNIDYGKVSLVQGHLNIKYAINGAGKSTLAKAIYKTVQDKNSGTSEINELTPFKAIGNEEVTPNVTGCEEFQSIKVFDEAYINEFVYQPDELLKGSFDILIRDENYETFMGEIEGLVSEIKNHFSEDPDIENLIKDFKELSDSFGRPTRAGIHGSSVLAKAFKDGNKVENIPDGLEMYKDFIQAEDNVKWVKWQIEGNQFVDRTDSCPYCVNEVSEVKDTIKKVGEVYNSKTVQNMNKIIGVFQRLEDYFSNETKEIISDFVSSLDGYNDEQIAFLKEVKDQSDRLSSKFNELKNIGFLSFKDVDAVIDQLKTFLIEPNLYGHLQSEKILGKIGEVNVSINELIEKAGLLQGKIAIQKRHIEQLVTENKSSINSFLKNAGYKYEVDLQEDQSGHHHLKLLHTELNDSEVTEVRNRLSYGECNAFALVLFMFDAVKSDPDLIVLDDPISSFDKNKKYAIIEMLFCRERNFRGNFRGKTVLLLSHDFEPIVDMIFHHGVKFDQPSASFIENRLGQLNEIEVSKSDIQTFMDINTQNIQASDNVVEKLVYLRRTYEVMNVKGMAYQLLSNVFHKRDLPLIFTVQENGEVSERGMSDDEIDEANAEIFGYIPEFNYQAIIELIKDDETMKELYRASTNNYEKLHLYRIIFEDKDDDIAASTIQKFINQSFHIENDYIYQLNPAKYQTVPQYVIDECDALIGA
ncbi:MAG: AAA family ATPase [Cellvibrionaceae bacterium]